MTEKKIDFLKHSKESTDEILPIEKDTLMEYIKAIPEDVAREYVNAIETNMESVLLWKNIMSARGSPRTCRHLVDGLNENQLESLRQIVVGLTARDPVEKLKEIIEATFSIPYLDPENYCKALGIVNKVKSFDVDFELKAMELATLSKQLNLLGEVFIVLALPQKEIPEWMVNRLCRCSTDDLDALMNICNSNRISDLCNDSYNEG